MNLPRHGNKRNSKQ